MIARPEVTEEYPQNLCLDAGYTGKQEAVTDRHYQPHIVSRGEEKKQKEKNPDFKGKRIQTLRHADGLSRCFILT